LISFLWWFNPGLYTPVQFFLTNQLHIADDAYSNFLGIFAVSFIPTYLLYGFFARKFPPIGSSGGERSLRCRKWFRSHSSTQATLLWQWQYLWD
jgi:hypothetical protein